MAEVQEKAAEANLPLSRAKTAALLTAKDAPFDTAFPVERAKTTLLLATNDEPADNACATFSSAPSNAWCADASFAVRAHSSANASELGA